MYIEHSNKDENIFNISVMLVMLVIIWDSDYKGIRVDAAGILINVTIKG